MTEPQGVLHQVFSDAGTLSLQRVAATASPYTGPSDKSLAAILDDVYDPATNTLRIVEV